MLENIESIDEVEARVNEEVGHVNAIIEEYNAVIQKTLELLETFSSKVRKTNK